MKNMSIKIFAIIITFLTVRLFSQGNTNPVVSDVDFSISGTTVTVTYNLSDAVQGTVIIRMLVSSDNGATWNYNYETATGDIGNTVSTGTNKGITWTYSGEPNDNFKIRIIADDNTAGGSTCGVATVDYGGQIYNTIQIGNQCWLRENLNYVVADSWCYSDNPNNCSTYGRLYTWSAAMAASVTPGAKGICPEGWHIPTLAEFQTLQAFVGGSTEGNRLKSTTQGTGVGIGTNTSGFAGLLGGYRVDNGNFLNLGVYSFFWSSTEVSEGSYDAKFLSLKNDVIDINLDDYSKARAFSIRCIKD